MLSKSSAINSTNNKIHVVLIELQSRKHHLKSGLAYSFYYLQLRDSSRFALDSLLSKQGKKIIIKAKNYSLIAIIPCILGSIEISPIIISSATKSATFNFNFFGRFLLV